MYVNRIYHGIQDGLALCGGPGAGGGPGGAAGGRAALADPRHAQLRVARGLAGPSKSGQK